MRQDSCDISACARDGQHAISNVTVRLRCGLAHGKSLRSRCDLCTGPHATYISVCMCDRRRSGATSVCDCVEDCLVFSSAGSPRACYKDSCVLSLCACTSTVYLCAHVHGISLHVHLACTDHHQAGLHGLVWQGLVCCLATRVCL